MSSYFQPMDLASGHKNSWIETLTSFMSLSHRPNGMLLGANAGINTISWPPWLCSCNFYCGNLRMFRAKLNDIFFGLIYHWCFLKMNVAEISVDKKHALHDMDATNLRQCCRGFLCILLLVCHWLACICARKPKGSRCRGSLLIMILLTVLDMKDVKMICCAYHHLSCWFGWLVVYTVVVSSIVLRYAVNDRG